MISNTTIKIYLLPLLVYYPNGNFIILISLVYDNDGNDMHGQRNVMYAIDPLYCNANYNERQAAHTLIKYIYVCYITCKYICTPMRKTIRVQYNKPTY